MQAAALLVSGLAAGLLAGTASCTAVQGGLLVGLADRRPSRPEPGRHPLVGPVVAARLVIGWFLLGRFAAHTVLGALLGWLGAAVQPPPAVRAALLVAAGCAVVVFAVRLLRGPRHACSPHGASRPGGTAHASERGTPAQARERPAQAREWPARARGWLARARERQVQAREWLARAH
ncbi:sulfite exporter TauE/SafE family protein, partial [Nonomuraea sp. RK-328]|nr:sulfite exporter TauE/SafE family protein [Nonomuraea sp. RK-328]